MTGLARRVLREKRAVIVPLAVVLALNLIIGILVVLPMSERVAQAEARQTAAIQELGAAQREFTEATATLGDTSRAEADLKTFYADVLPPDMAGARRSTYVHLAQLAKDAELQYQRRQEDPREPKAAGQNGPVSRLTRFDITMVLKGHYESVRQFIRDVEASDRFIVIDNIGISQGTETGQPLVLTVELSTFYRTAGRGF
jgi:Tfp pilus assembly protein PilO